MGLREKNEENEGGRKGKNKTKERRNPPKISLLLGAKLIFLREGGGKGNNMIHLHNINACIIIDPLRTLL